MGCIIIPHSRGLPMRYGFFDDARCEYVISQPDTPLPWINYLGCEEFFGLISNRAGGYAFYKDARLRRLIRYRYNNAPLDIGGRCLYLRDDDLEPQDRLTHYWSPTGQPAQRSLEGYECRHGLGYTTIRSQCSGIDSRFRFFVPLHENMEIWELNISNRRDTPANISLFAAVEFCLWNAWEDASNYQRNLSLGEVEVDEGVIYHKTEYRERRDHFAYFACSHPVAGFDTQREAFLGAYRGWDAPAAVEAGEMSNSIAHGWQPIGAQHVKLHVESGEERRIIFLLGYHENAKTEKFQPPNSQTINKTHVKPIIARYLQRDQVEASFQSLRSYWRGVLNKLHVTTPDGHTNRMVNIWNVYQVMATFNLSRSASYFESGVGRGMGFRDSNQDLLGVVHMIPERARERILDLAATQLPDGGVFHQYQPLTKLGNSDIGSGFNDDPLWLVLSVAAYIKETGDWSILEQSVPYENRTGTEEPLYSHLQRSIRFTLDRLGPHGLPLIGHADWNDCLNLNCFSDEPGQSFQTTSNKDGKVAESVFIAGLFILAVNEMVDIARRHQGEQEADKYAGFAREMEQAIWAAGWDGKWFRRAYDDFGNPVGSAQCDEGKIFIEPQGICVMAGLGVENGRAMQALDSVAEWLATQHGIVLQQPAYSHYYLHLGEISSYPPGYKENAGVFCHSNPWIMIAETMVGNGDRAHDYYLRINPSAREGMSDLHSCEPYVYAQMIAGRDASRHGEAKNSWLTGTAAWNYVTITQWILGVRPTLDGLLVAPVIPSSWEGYRMLRCYRGVRYVIDVERCGPGGEVELTVDGQTVEGAVIPIPPAGTTEVKVHVRLR
jgi:cellobiose phosphorylase